MERQPAARRRGVDIFDASRPLWQLFLLFLLPFMLSNILQTASGSLNSVFVGRMIGVNALAAISAFLPVAYFLISFMIGISSGASVLIGQAFGAGDHHRMKAVVGTTISLSLMLGIAVAIVGGSFLDRILGLLGTPSNVLSDAYAYARFTFFAFPIFFVYFGYITLLRGTGDSQTPLYFLIVSTVCSVLVTPMLIRGWLGLPSMGVVSAAIAAIFANFVALIGLFAYLRFKRHPLQLDAEILRDLRPDWNIARSIFRIGVPAGMQTVLVSLAEIAVLSFVNRFGSHATAAYGAVNQVVAYVQFPALSIGITSSIFGAQCIGADRRDMLRRVVHAGIALNYAIGSLLVGICYLFSWSILGWFLTDAETLRTAHRFLLITLWSYLLFGNSAVLSGIMRSSGTVLWPTVIAIGAIWGIEVPLAYVLMHRFGLEGIWFGYPSAFVAALVSQGAYYLFVWKKKSYRRLG